MTTRATDRTPATGRRLLFALLAAAATALVAHLANLLAYFIGNQLQPGSIPQVNAYFLLSSVLGFVVVLALAIAGTLGRAWLAALTGLVAGVVGAVFGTLVQASATGDPVTGAVWVSIFQTFAGLNLVFLLAFTVSAATVGRAVWLRVRTDEAPTSASVRRIALVRAPAADLSACELTHLERVPVDQQRAQQQWEAYVDLLERAGWESVEAAPAPDLADSVFLEDAVVVFGDHAVIARSGAQSRRGEAAGAEEAARALGLTVDRIEEPATLDGGDVLTVGSTVYVGRGGRTDAAGIAQLRAILRPRGYDVVAVPLSTVLHLKSAVTALPDGTVIGWEPAVDEPRLFPSFLPMPEESGAQVVVLDDDTLLMAASAPRSAELLRSLGYRVLTVDISEFEKLEGCVTCLSVRVR
ncbi:dimethylarginine dimethylaminohydrolase [Rathayibacter rathayi]|nr:dimethylarginine dimethylaminohydrolase [Rathayibacter rathayi]PPG14847.1 dimethylarginine dimethylaminohydrolase [Rathayibacter rathayi]PPG41671.1 dimethylarginine dimethylaminohydrolase [Rathayibacter rathayi]